MCLHLPPFISSCWTSLTLSPCLCTFTKPDLHENPIFSQRLEVVTWQRETTVEGPFQCLLLSTCSPDWGKQGRSTFLAHIVNQSNHWKNDLEWKKRNRSFFFKKGSHQSSGLLLWSSFWASDICIILIILESGLICNAVTFFFIWQKNVWKTPFDKTCTCTERSGGPGST